MENSFKFLPVPAFKNAFNISTIEVLKNEHENGEVKFFCSTDLGETFKAQKNIDLSGRLAVMIDITGKSLAQATLADCCLINPKSQATTVGTL
jgi:hypothetical protein